MNILIRSVRSARTGPLLSWNPVSGKRYGSSGVQEIAYELNNVYKSYRLQTAPSMTGTLSKKEAIDMYYNMSKIRRLEFVSANLYRQKLIRGFCHTYTGQEACCVGQKSVMGPDDCIITSYRCHGWSYIMGVTADEIMAELMGKKSGCSRGKGGSMHIYGKNFFGGNGIVGAQCPLGTGIAMALHYQKKNAVCLCLYGDGAANQGQLFESINIACLWKLPVIFICENNLYGMGTETSRHSCNTEYFTRGDLVPGLWVDGQNVLAVKNGTAFAKEYALKSGPIIMELETYRYHGHSMSDPGTSYRTRDEVKQVQAERDPLKIMRSICIEGSLVTKAEFDEIDRKIKDEVDASVEKSKKDAEVDMKELAGDLSYNNCEPKIRGLLPWAWLDHVSVAKRPPYKPKPTPPGDINTSQDAPHGKQGEAAASKNTKAGQGTTASAAHDHLDDMESEEDHPKPTAAAAVKLSSAAPAKKQATAPTASAASSKLNVDDKLCYAAESAPHNSSEIDPPKTNKGASSGKPTCFGELSERKSRG